VRNAHNTVFSSKRWLSLPLCNWECSKITSGQSNLT